MAGVIDLPAAAARGAGRDQRLGEVGAVDGGELLAPVAEHRSDAEPGHAEDLEHLAVARAVDRRRPHDRPGQRAGRDGGFGGELAAPVGRDRVGRLVAGERPARLGGPARRHRRHQHEPRPSPRCGAAPAAARCRRGWLRRNSSSLRAATRPATWYTTSCPATARASEAESSRSPAMMRTPSGASASAFFAERASAVTSITPPAQRLHQVAADEAGRAGHQHLHIGRS